MNYRVTIPKTIRELIGQLEISKEMRLEVFNRLHNMADDHLDVCLRMAGPTPTFIFNIELPDENQPSLFHCFTFYLSYGQQEGVLYVRDYHYHQFDDLEHDSDQQTD